MGLSNVGAASLPRDNDVTLSLGSSTRGSLSVPCAHGFRARLGKCWKGEAGVLVVACRDSWESSASVWNEARLYCVAVFSSNKQNFVPKPCLS